MIEAHTQQDGAAQKPMSPWDLLNNRLRGRWRYALVLALPLAVAGASLGYILAPSKYLARGSVSVISYIKPRFHETLETGAMPAYATFLAGQVDELRSERVMSAALALEEMRGSPFVTETTGRKVLTESLTVEFASRNSNVILVQVEHEDPNVAHTAVNAILTAYDDLESSEDRFEKELQEHTAWLTRKRNELSDVERAMGQFVLASRFAKGGRLDEARTAYFTEYMEAETQLREVQDRIAQLAAGGEEQTDAPEQEEFEPTRSELDAFYDELGGRRANLGRMKTQLDQRRQRYGDSHRFVRDLEQAIEVEERHVTQLEAQIREELLATHGHLIGGAAIDALQEREELLKTQAAELSDTLSSIVEEETQLSSFQRRIQNLETDVQMAVDRVDDLEANAESIKEGRTDVHFATAPTWPEKDKRKQMAAVGFLGGAGLPFAVFFLLGTLDRRAFDSSQLQLNELNCECVGVLPDLSRAANDPEIKALAAQCIHRLRNRIELQRDHEQAYIVSVTSPFQGDGKTSLAFALAWSYSATKTKTLLVDCDFVGRSLSLLTDCLRRDGVKECLASGSVNGEIRRLAGADLDVLGVGRSSQFGPESGRLSDYEKLFAKLRDRYEVIIVDTGPMLGSVEAAPVIASSDGVVLALRRGRPRKRLNDCVRDIRAAGSHCLGVVLNCAQSSDCSRYSSVSRVSAEVEAATLAEAHPLSGDANQERYHVIDALRSEQSSEA